jgi:CDP-paratose 2-epimerase
MKIVVTGGAGFIGSNLVEYFLKKKNEVVIFDNLSRPGSRINLSWIKSIPGNLRIVEGDVRNDFDKLCEIVNNADVVFHFAAQVAVTTSVINPREDFEINALGTINVCEAVRKSKKKPILFYSSTNKVYGEMEEVKTKELTNRYAYISLKNGVSERRPLDFHSPYGCSKGVADQYVRDYSRIYGLRTVVFRQSCVYGKHQFGIEDQGWVAWFIIALTHGKKITIYGNGKQVRDLLEVSDLVRAYVLAIKNINKTSGQIYNIGGGLKNSISIWLEFRPILEELFGKKIKANFSDWRPGDQPIFISDNSKAKNDFGWEPQVGVRDGLKKLYEWVQENKEIFV